MNIYKVIVTGFIATALTACTATDEKPTAADLQTTSSQELNGNKPLVDKLAALATNQIAAPSNLSRLEGQVTALQEQVIKLSSESASILKLSQLLLAKAQVQALTAYPSNVDIPNKQVNANQSDSGNSKSLNTVLKKLESIAPSAIGAFGIVSSYTASKQWVLIRFDRQTGETWLADNNGWNKLADDGDLDISQYDVHLIRADQDQKGYVASRIDQRSGETWWLNNKQWVIY